ncbi:GPI ethanolamine phosphate transferase 3 [Xenopus tropicalis]|uniref:GPI ethanolamine phosphate transferase 3, catalytic subunit n=1 Tax=Xenopus tropicalis TaxID=8364 RepID=B1H2Q3_XENTR|nr:GPI ethanolamine phosphate transferase 3 [Xenopus tropicalis]AAI61087.1 LOC100145458 protein [Xenopus tropicalis]|eukprot:NP_001120383.1 GPI ethanolamine phosphate transferase 3 [Xenopus tropicalis]
MRRGHVLLFLAWVSILFYSGIWIFMSGFLLMRIELNNQSSCADLPSSGPQGPLQQHPGTCWLPRRFQKAVIIIIDALKYDFAKYEPGITNPKPYQNKLPVIHQLSTSQPRHARLYPFRADPPTTTMQRIKGMTTGSLPTFVDVGSNFASYAIQEDNLIHQLVENGRRVVFMGDDTWDGLFPKKFFKSYFFPSFNVKDLHTVDNGILQHLYPTRDSGDWDVIIAHFLGVDHCGHKHGPDHPETANKLAQMNQVISSLVEHLDEETLLLVAGDHGMTDTGDHGGDSEKEVMAALFLYSKSPLFSHELSKEAETVPQVNLVPTLSLLLGLPIPYSNLGAVMPDLFSWPKKESSVSAALTLASAVHINALQVGRFLHSYSLAAGDLPSDKLRDLKSLLSSLMSEYEQLISERSRGSWTESEYENRLRQHVLRVQRYLVQARAVCMESWARFHPLRMLAGCAILAATCLLCYLAAETGMALDLSCKFLLTYPLFGVVGAGALLAFGKWLSLIEWDCLSLWALVIAASQLTFFYSFRKQMQVRVRLRFRQLSLLFSGPCLILIFRCGSLFSDSFVVAEGHVAPFLLMSLLVLTIYKLHWDGRLTLPTLSPLGGDTTKLTLSTGYRKDGPILLALLGALTLCVRLSGIFHNCREETPDCHPSLFLAPLSNVKDPQLKNISYLGCIVCLVAIVYMVRKWLQHYGNLNSSSALVLYVRWGFPLIALAITCHWALSAGAEDSLARLRDLIQLALVACPRAVYGLAALGLVFLLWNPVTVFMKSSRDSDADNTVTTYSGAPGSQAELLHVIPQIYRKMQRTMKSRLRHGTDEEEENKGAAIEAYGLSSVYSAAMIVTLSLLTMVLLLLHSERITPAFLILLVEAFVILHIHSHVQNLYYAPDSSDQFSVPWYAVISWALAGTQWFYSTGHQPVFPAIHWNSAFVGFQEGHENNITPAVLVAANTFSAHILFSAGSSLLLLWPFLCETPGKKKKGKKEAEEMPLMEMRLRENPDKFAGALLQLGTKYLFIQGVQLLSCVCAAMILRRHLMVWKVFAPKFLFEAAGFTVSSVFLFLGIVLLLRVDSAVKSWFKSLILQQQR